MFTAAFSEKSPDLLWNSNQKTSIDLGSFARCNITKQTYIGICNKTSTSWTDSKLKRSSVNKNLNLVFSFTKVYSELSHFPALFRNSFERRTNFDCVKLCNILRQVCTNDPSSYIFWSLLITSPNQISILDIALETISIIPSRYIHGVVGGVQLYIYSITVMNLIEGNRSLVVSRWCRVSYCSSCITPPPKKRRLWRVPLLRRHPPHLIFSHIE